MNAFPSIILAIVITIIVAADTTRASSESTRQGPRSQEHDVARIRRHLLEDNSECVLYLKVMTYADAVPEQKTWSCEFPRTYAQEILGGRRDNNIMDVEGMDKEEIEAHHAVSGETVMVLPTGAVVVEQSVSSLDHNGFTAPGGDAIKLVVTDPSAVVFESITDDDVRHHRHYKKKRRRRLNAKKNMGVLTTLVVRPRSPNGAIVEVSPAKLRNDIFEDTMCLKSQMAACSFNQVEIQPATIGDGGVVDVEIDVNPSNDGDGNTNEIATKARVKTEELYGGAEGLLKTEFDIVLFCLPPGSGNWVAYTFVNGYDSYYNNKFCTSSDILMHEVGHNFGLGHSELPPPSIWSRDFTGLMSGAGSADDPPRRCYNVGVRLCTMT